MTDPIDNITSENAREVLDYIADKHSDICQPFIIEQADPLDLLPRGEHIVEKIVEVEKLVEVEKEVKITKLDRVVRYLKSEKIDRFTYRDLFDSGLFNTKKAASNWLGKNRAELEELLDM